ncbi:acyltransferase [Cetobacterium somerae]|uniref:acyltransferase n=1 Tax=Cetobacterium somerae TaxID=188913 RepID=UPI001F05F034|nr:acyltransferase [Cetobacterium somerae]UPO97390.1 acyltransferase [Cetobacterium somerae]
MYLKIKYLFQRSIVKIKNERNNLKIEGKLRASKIKVEGEGNQLKIGKNSFLKQGKISIKGSNNTIIIGENCDLKNLKIFMQDNNSTLIIGDNTTCAGAKILSQEGCKIKLGKNCMLSYDIEIRNSDSHKIFSEKSKERINEGKNIILEDNIWIGMRTLILKGSYVEKNSVIAAGSIVVNRVYANTIVAGSPAKEVKKAIYWER